MQVILVRHGKTTGNQKRLYIGRADEPLCEEGIASFGRTDSRDCTTFPLTA